MTRLNKPGGHFCTSTMRRKLPVVTVGEFSSTTTCYPEPNGRDRPEAGCTATEQNEGIDAMESVSMDRMTARFYESYVQRGTVDSEAPYSAISKYFHVAFKAGDKVLDVGSGSGRDLAVLLKNGVDAYGIEPNDSMRTYSLTNHPELAGRVQPGSLPITRVPFGGRFDAVLCSAVLMHIQEGCFFESWKSLLQVLKPSAKILFSLPSMHPGLLRDRRDNDGRFFENHRSDVVGSILRSLGFSEIHLGVEATSVYPDITWTISLFESTAATSGRMCDNPCIPWSIRL